MTGYSHIALICHNDKSNVTMQLIDINVLPSLTMSHNVVFMSIVTNCKVVIQMSHNWDILMLQCDLSHVTVLNKSQGYFSCPL